MDRRAEHLVEQGWPSGRASASPSPQPDRHAAPRVEALGEKLAAETGQPFNRAAAANMSPAPIASASRSPPAASP
jgi:hypothetical protein